MDQDKVSSAKRTRIVRPYPVHTLEDACSIGQAIQDVNSGLPFDRVLLAKALGTTPASSGFTMKLNSSAKYGLTQGGYNDERIALTAQGRAVAAPTRSGETRQALLEAALRPELFRRFYQVLDGKRVPEDAYAQNILQRELGLHAALTDECLRIVTANGLHVGILTDADGALYVSMSGELIPDEDVRALDAGPSAEASARPEAVRREGSGVGSKILIGHAGSPEIVDFVRTVLDEFDIPYGVVESEFEDERPLPADAATEMRECGAAILVFAKPSWSRVSGGREVSGQEMMLYQLGAASVLYGERIIALTEEGVEPGGYGSGFQTLQFHRERLGEIALALLSELHRIGVLEVRTPPRAAVSRDNG